MRQQRFHRSRRDERGVSMIIVTSALGALLVMGAFAADMGRAYAERRHDQNAADTAVTSGAVEATIGGGSYPEIIAEIRAKVDATLDKTVTDAEWLACTDSEHLHYTAKDLAGIRSDIPLATECISWSIEFLEMRVRVPDQEVPGIFGPMIGADNKVTSAAANASINEPGVGAPPFVALSTAAAGDFVCLRTSTNPEPPPLLDGNGPGVPPSEGTRLDPCHSDSFDTSSENFGTLKPWRYLDGCKQQNADVEVGISIGIDHNMTAYPAPGYSPGMPEKVDGADNCTEPNPNTFETDEGLNAQGLRCALISLKNDPDCNSVDPRFHQGAWVQDDILFAGEMMDNVAPWEFLIVASELHADGAPKDCVVVAASRTSDDFSPGTDGGYSAYVGVDDDDWDHYDRFDAFTRCLQDWGTEIDGSTFSSELFTEDIVSSGRFAFIPQVHEADLSVDFVHIESFVPTFMYRLYQTESSGGTPCDPIDPRATVPFYMHDAGQTYGHNGEGPSIDCGLDNQNVDRLASIVLACGMMPDILCDKEEQGEPVAIAGRDFYEIRLTK